MPNDRDGDGIIDTQDACPDVAGILAYRGCPDQDYDGLPDPMDRCPLEAGPRERAGCPVSDIDADGDEDILLGNWGMNTKFNLNFDGPLLMYHDDFDKNGKTETLLAYNIAVFTFRGWLIILN